MNVSIDRDKFPSALDGTIGLCYYNPQEETLKEFDPNTSIVLGPFEESVRRFYIVKPSGVVQGSVYSYVKLTASSASPTFDIKLKIGGSYLSDIEDFSSIEGKECVAFFSHYTNGLIPVDFYCKNSSTIENTTSLELTLEVL